MPVNERGKRLFCFSFSRNSFAPQRRIDKAPNCWFGWACVGGCVPRRIGAAFRPHHHQFIIIIASERFMHDWSARSGRANGRALEGATGRGLRWFARAVMGFFRCGGRGALVRQLGVVHGGCASCVALSRKLPIVGYSVQEDTCLMGNLVREDALQWHCAVQCNPPQEWRSARPEDRSPAVPPLEEVWGGNKAARLVSQHGGRTLFLSSLHLII
jgi:hypothetical protein